MNVKEILSRIALLAKNKGLSEPFIVGGIPRDMVLNQINKIDDIDITTGDNDSHQLSRLAYQELKPYFPNHIFYKTMEDGHSQLGLNRIKLDFSSNYRTPGIQRILQQAKANDSEMMQELMSRDFTCNILLMTLDLKNIKDLTGLGIKDINKKLLRTPLPPYITLTFNKKRIVRILYLAAKLGFEVEPDIISWVKNHPEAITDGVKPKYISKMLQKAMGYDADRTVKLLDKMGLWRVIPPTEKLMPYIVGGHRG